MALGEPIVGRGIGGYEILETIAHGGMGVVYKARDQRVHRTVALKMAWSAGNSEATLKRFRVEALAAAGLDHPNIVPIYEVGENDGQPYFTMKFIGGGSLADRLESFRREPRAAARLIARVARAIHHAHQRGVLHRDLKPANILLNEELEPFVTDFGLARRFEEESDLTHTGAIMGTPNYMSPEQALGDGARLTTAADIFSLGAVLYHLLAGTPPFKAETAMETLRLAQEAEPAAPSTMNFRIGKDLETICLKCLEKDPRNRYRFALELAQDLERWLGGETILARRATPAERALKWVRRKPVIAGLAISVVVAALAGVAGIFMQWREAEAARTVAEKRRERETIALTEASQQRDNAEKAFQNTAKLLTQIELEKADSLLAQGNSSGGLAYLARVSRRDPSNTVAVARIMSFLSRPAVPVTELTDFEPASRVIDMALSPDHQRAVAILDQQEGNLLVWNFSPDSPALAPLTHPYAMPRLGTARESGGGRGAGFPGIGPPPSITGPPPGVRPPPGPFRGFRGSPRGGNPANSDDGPFDLRFRPIYASFSQDGRRILSRVGTGRMRAWKWNEGEPVGPFIDAGSTILAVSYSGADDLLTAVYRNGPVRFWNMKDGEVARGFESVSGARLARFNSDGSRVLIADSEPGAELWDVQAGKFIARAGEPLGTIKTMAVEGDILAFAGEKTASVLHARADNSTLHQFSHPAAVTTMAVAGDGSLLATACADNAARVWDARSGQLLAPPLAHPAPLLALAFSPDGKLLATLCRDNGARVWETATGRPICEPIVPSGLAIAAQFSAEGLIVLCRDGSVLRCKFTSPPPSVRALSGAGSPEMGGFNQVGSVVFTVKDGVVSFWNATSSQTAAPSITNASEIVDATFSPDGRTFLTADAEGVVRLRDWPSGETRRLPWFHSNPIMSARFSADGKKVAVLTRWGLGRVWNVETGEASNPEHSGPLSDRSAISPNEDIAMTGMGIARAAGLFDMKSGERIGAFMKHADMLGVGGFSPDGEKVITASFDNTARIWSARTAAPLTPPLRHGAGVPMAGFSPDGSLAVTVSEDKNARLWDVASGASLHHTLAHFAAVRHAEFSGDGRRLLTVADDFSVHCWDTRLGQRLADPLPHGSKVIVAKISSDGQSILTISEADGARLLSMPEYPLPAPEWLAELAEMIGGARIDAQGLTQPAFQQSMAQLRAKAANDAGSSFYRDRLAWLLSPKPDERN